MRKRSVFSLLAVATPFLLTAACSSGGGGPAGTVDSSNPAGALTDAVSEVPLAGQFLADCSEDGFAVIQGFSESSPLPEPPADAPVIGDVLASGDPDELPVIGGFMLPELPGGDLTPLDIDETLSMIPMDGLPADLPVVGVIPVTCGDTPLPEGDLPEPTDALALIPIFDGNGDPVAVLLAVVGDGDPSLTDVALPEPDSVLPEPLAETTGTLTSLLGDL